MLDTYGREVRTLRLAVTETCDLRCRYCMPEKGLPTRSEPLSQDELVEIARAATQCGIQKIRLTGGEPLFRPDLLEICQRIAQIDGIHTLCLTTNGTRLAALARPLREAGVKRVNVSIDSLNVSRYAEITRGGSLPNVVKGLEEALQAGFERVKVNCVLMGGINDGEINDFIELTKFKPLEVRFIELMPMGECSQWPEERFLPAEKVLYTCPMLDRIDDEGVTERYRLKDAVGTVGLIRPMSHMFCGSCDRIRVTADGMLKPCLHSAMEMSLRGLSGKELEKRIIEGINAKPATHHLNETGTQTKRSMCQIGG